MSDKVDVLGDGMNKLSVSFTIKAIDTLQAEKVYAVYFPFKLVK